MKFKFVLLFLLSVLLIGGPAAATTLTDLNVGGNITIHDTIWNSDLWTSGPYGPGLEDNETEKTALGANATAGQEWDLEGIFWNSHDATLTIVGGFNFDYGLDTYYLDGTVRHHYSIGDVFIGEFSDQYADPNNPDLGRLFTAEYALDLDRDGDGDVEAGDTGIIFKDTVSNSLDSSGVTDVTPASNPYQYQEGGINFGSFSLETGTVTGTGFYGYGTNDTHYYLKISGLEELKDIINSGKVVHITMECGNDSVRAAVPEPTTILLSGIGLLGMGVYLRRKQRVNR